MTLQTPVVLIIFKRADTTAKVFEAIRQAKPQKLLVIADGPRSHIPGEAEKCAKTRAIIDGVDWECEVFKNYSDVNLSCRDRVPTGLDWVFENVEEAIILEDDCLPHPSFFKFAWEMLEKYRHDTRVMHIAGCNFGISGSTKNESYYFSSRTDIWGWATWKRAWKYYDVNMRLWPDFKKEERLLDIVNYHQEYQDKLQRWERYYTEDVTNWDLQWHFACVTQGNYSIVSSKNLITNIGFGADALNTKDSKSIFANLKAEELEFPLVHPKFFIRDKQADIRYAKLRQSEYPKNIFKRIIRKIQRNLK